MKRDIQDYGNKLSILGMVVGNGEEAEIIALDKIPENLDLLNPSEEELSTIFNQLDTLNITTSQKVILRKSQRNLDQKVAWKVYRRDGFKCVYCNEENEPLTVDHIILWEENGDSVPANLISSCKKCNHTRGNMPFEQWIESPYLLAKMNSISTHPADIQNMKTSLMLRYEKAKAVPLRPTKRSR